MERAAAGLHVVFSSDGIIPGCDYSVVSPVKVKC